MNDISKGRKECTSCKTDTPTSVEQPVQDPRGIVIVIKQFGVDGSRNEVRVDLMRQR